MKATRVLGIALLIFGIAGSAQAGTKLYTGSLSIHGFGNDISTGSVAPFTSASFSPIPFGPKVCDIRQFPSLPTSAPCSLGPNPNTCPKPPEVFTFMNHVAGSATPTVSHTVPQYGGAPGYDTTSPSCTTGGTPMLPATGCTDGIADIGCYITPTFKIGNPLVGGGTAATAGSGLLAFSLPAAAPTTVGVPVTTGLSAASSGGQFTPVIPPYQFSILYGDMRNEQGNFTKGFGPGNFVFNNVGVGVNNRMQGTTGPNRFGGTMRLLGHFFTNEGFISGTHLGVASYTWLFHKIGGAGAITGTQTTGGAGHVLTAPEIVNSTNMVWTTMGGSTYTSNVSAFVVPWTTGTVTASAPTGPTGADPTLLVRKGYDNRDASGYGTIQLVSPMITRWAWPGGKYTTGSVGVLKVVFAPEPQAWMMLAAGVGSLGFLFRSNRRRK